MTGEFFWTRAINRFGWESLRGDYAATDSRAGHFSASLGGGAADRRGAGDALLPTKSMTREGPRGTEGLGCSGVPPSRFS